MQRVGGGVRGGGAGRKGGSRRAVLGISEPTEAELKKQAAFQGKARAKVVS